MICQLIYQLLLIRVKVLFNNNNQLQSLRDLAFDFEEIVLQKQGYLFC